MAEYIDRNELIENLNKFAPEHYSALINQLITKQPTADVVEVVRCKDCKYYNVRRVSARWHNTKKCCCRGAYKTVNEFDFCSFGERKDT